MKLVNKEYIIIAIISFMSINILTAQNKITIEDPHLKTDVTFIETTIWKDGSNIDDNKVDGVLFIKKSNIFYKRVYDGKINVKWFGAKGDGVIDDSKAIQAALNYGESIFFPAGTYKFNAFVVYRMQIEGNSGNTYFIPANKEQPVLSFNAKAPYWSYSSSISNIIFKSNNKTGIAVSFGSGSLEDKKTHDEYAGNVVFKNILFTDFDKAVFFPFGNIGCNFFSCSFQRNNYGIYSLDNKFGGDIMHAGNKYFYACEFDSNNIGAYFHNTTEGFGGVSFTDCIFQYNAVNGYFYTNNTYVPISFQNCWDEKKDSSINKIYIDQFNGRILTKKIYTPASYIFEGSSSSYIFIGGRIMNMNINGDNIIVSSYSSKFEFQKGAGADKFTISDKSYLKLFYPSTDQGIQISPQIIIEGFPVFSTGAIKVSPFNPEARYVPMDNKEISSENKVAPIFEINFNKIVKLSGSFVPKPSTMEQNVYSNTISNRLSLDYTQSNQYISIDDTRIKLKKGYYFMILNFKVNKGTPMIYIWDRNENQFVRIKPVLDTQYHAYGTYGYLSNNAEMFIDISSLDGKPVDISIESYRIYQFNSKNDLDNFLFNNISNK